MSLNSGTIHLASVAKVPFKARSTVVGYDVFSSASPQPWQTYTLPYLFQSLDTTKGEYKLALCEPALVSALQYTDVGGEKGSHPNFPPFPLCSLGQAVMEAPVSVDFPQIPNPAQAPQGYSKKIDKTIESENDKAQVFATWLSEWTATITVPDTLVKTVSSGTMCCPLCIPCLCAKFTVVSFCLTSPFAYLHLLRADTVIGPLTWCGLLICCPR